MEEARGGNKGAEKREKECGREREEFCAVVKNPDPAHRVESWGQASYFGLGAGPKGSTAAAASPLPIHRLDGLLVLNE